MAQINHEELKKQMGNSAAGLEGSEGANMQNLESDKLPTANIIVAGATGAGKSTLLNAVFRDDIAKEGVGRPVTPDIKAYGTPEDRIHIWDTMGLELDAAKTEKSIADIKKTIASKTSSKDPFDHIHAIWYCLLTGGNRYQGFELNFVKSLHSLGVPFIIVITQCMRGEADNQFEKIVSDINKSEGLHNIDIVKVLAKDYETAVGTVPAHGLDRLVGLTMERLPAFIDSGFAAAQQVDKVLKRRICEDIVYDYVLGAKNGFWDKVPIINILTTDYKIHNMLKKIGEMYNMVLSTERIKDIQHEARFDFSGAFPGLINPFYSGYRGKVARFLAEMQEKEGFEVKSSEFSSSERAARVIAFYGYTYIMAVEEVWDKANAEQRKNINMIVDKLIISINNKMNEARRGRRGN